MENRHGAHRRERVRRGWTIAVRTDLDGYGIPNARIGSPMVMSATASGLETIGYRAAIGEAP